MSDRRELIRNAVSFLADPKVRAFRVYRVPDDSYYVCMHCASLQTQSSPVSQRIQFLEAKGLTSAEIDDAMKEAALLQGGPSYAQPYRTAYPSAYPPSAYSVMGPPPTQPWDWRDYFVSLTPKCAIL